MNQPLVRIVAAISLCLFAVISNAREIYNSPAKAVQAGVIAVDSLPEHYVDCNYHFRIEIPPKCRDARWGVTLLYADGSFSTLNLSRRGAAAAESDYGIPVDAELTIFAPDSSSTASSSFHISDNIDPTIDSWSIVITRLNGSPCLLCEIGQRNSQLEIELLADGLSAIETKTESGGLRLARLSYDAKTAVRATATAASTEAELADKLGATMTSESEGYWRYLDRDTDPLRLTTGGDYKLATLSAPDGSIEIIYLGGAVRNADQWKPMMLKGRLWPTNFDRHYDLVWYDAFGAVIDSETSADIIGEGGAILKLNFPLNGGSIRFRRNDR